MVPVVVLKGWSVINTSWRSLYMIPKTTDAKKIKKEKSGYNMTTWNPSCKCGCLNQTDYVNQQANLYVFVDVFQNWKNWRGIKKLLFVVAHRRFRKLKSTQTVVGKVSRGNLQARLQFLFPKTKVTSTFAVGFLYSQHWWRRNNRDEIKSNTFSKKYFSCWSESKS